MISDRPINKYVYRSVRREAFTGDLRYVHLPKNAPWFVVRGIQGENGRIVPGTEEYLLWFPSQRQAQDTALVLGQAFWDGRCQERDWQESRR